MENEKIYCGNGKEMFNGSMVAVTLCVSDLPKEHIFEYNDKKYIKLKVSKKRNGADDYGRTHYVEVDTWKPEQQQQSANVQTADDDDIPF